MRSATKLENQVLMAIEALELERPDIEVSLESVTDPSRFMDYRIHHGETQQST